MPFDSAATMARRQLCQVCWAHRSGFRRSCYVCRRRVGPGCRPYCLAQDGSCEWPQAKRSLCKDCFVSMQQQILPLAATVPEALVIVAEQNMGKHCWHPRNAIEWTPRRSDTAAGSSRRFAHRCDRDVISLRQPHCLTKHHMSAHDHMGHWPCLLWFLCCSFEQNPGSKAVVLMQSE